MDGPKEVDGKVIEGTFRAHQVPISMEKGRTSGAAGGVAAELPAGGTVRRRLPPIPELRKLARRVMPA